MRRLHLELAGRVPSAGEYARHARAWLTDARTELFQELSARLPQGRALRPQGNDPAAPVGPPGATWAQSVQYQQPSAPYRGTRVLYTPGGWQRVLDGLAEAYPFKVSFLMTPLDEEGRLHESQPSVSFRVDRDSSDPSWARFLVSAPAELASWPAADSRTETGAGAEIETGWVSFLERWASRLDACYGHLTDDGNDTNGTALEMSTQRPGIDPPTVPRCREVLRGYSWVTICAAQLAARLGGAAALASSGAFYQVRELPGGQVLLRATPLLEQYEGTAVERAFRVLAPVLLTGQVDEQMMPGGARLVLGADAADYR